ncbi:hypothetical protein [Ktedonospora formicarum]|uniref:hypothetical protein n=1 Tax=Ktedonospora formicarum TaxID=2778364 RepID=UPI001C687A40|nr:hypothetical protein [Ktedonospora formicarum]
MLSNTARYDEEQLPAFLFPPRSYTSFFALRCPLSHTLSLVDGWLFSTQQQQTLAWLSPISPLMGSQRVNG